MYSSLPFFESQVIEKIDTGDLNFALNLIIKFASSIARDSRATANVLGSATLDALCQRIGAEALKDKHYQALEEVDSERELVVYITTDLPDISGHTAVIEDFIKVQPEKEHLILITDTLHFFNPAEIKYRFASLSVEIERASESSALDKLKWLQQILIEKRPNQVYLFNYSQDAVAIAAVQPSLTPQLFFYHQSDFIFCLGLYLAHAKHIDIHPYIFYKCRDELGILNNVYFPLTAEDMGVHSSNFSGLSNGKLRTCSSGRRVKFEHPYLYAYAELVPKILAVTGGVHIHIGELPPRLIDIINQGLKTQEIDPKRFIHIFNVKSIWKTMHEQSVDIYLDSFTIGGARTVIEVMGSGTPIIGHQNYRSCAFSTINIVYPEAFYWRIPDELLNYLQTLTPEVLLMQATCSRKHYELYHTPTRLRQQLMLIGLKEDGLLPPPLKNYLRDDLQAFLDQIDLNNLSLRIRLQQAQATIKATTTRMLSSEFWKLQTQKQWFKLKKFLRLVNDV